MHQSHESQAGIVEGGREFSDQCLTCIEAKELSGMPEKNFFHPQRMCFLLRCSLSIVSKAHLKECQEKISHGSPPLMQELTKVVTG